MPMLMTIFSSFGICMTFSMPRSSCSLALISSLYFPFRRGISVATCGAHPISSPHGRAMRTLVPSSLDLVADADLLALVHQHHVAGVDGHVLVDDAALLVGTARLRVLRRRVDAVHDDLVGLREDVLDLALLALVLAGDHLDGVTLLELHHNTSGASDTMRMNLRSRSSRPTGPKMRVPRGVMSSLMRTAAFSSKRM